MNRDQIVDDYCGSLERAVLQLRYQTKGRELMLVWLSSSTQPNSYLMWTARLFSVVA